MQLGTFGPAARVCLEYFRSGTLRSVLDSRRRGRHDSGFSIGVSPRQNSRTTTIHNSVSLPDRRAPVEIYPVFVKRGDASGEIEQLVRDSGGTPEKAGLQKYFYVAKANQTVAIVSKRDSPLAVALRAKTGWMEPIEEG